MHRASTRAVVVACCLVVLLGLSLRFVGVDQKDCWYDEGITHFLISRPFMDWGSFAGRPVSAGELLQFLQPNVDSFAQSFGNFQFLPDQAPLYYLLAKAYSCVFTNQTDSLRLLSGFLSILITPAFFWLALECTGSVLVGVIAAAIISVSPMVTIYSTEARPYMMFVINILLAHIFLVKGLKTQRFVWWALCGSFLAVAVLTHLIGVFMVPAYFLVMLVARSRPRDILIAVTPSLVAFLGWSASVGKPAITSAQEHCSQATFCAKAISPTLWFDGLATCFSKVFWDPGFYYLFANIFNPNVAGRLMIPLALSISTLVLVAIALIAVLLKSDFRQKLILFALLFQVPLLLASDIILHGSRASVLRYEFAPALALIMTVSLFVGMLIMNSNKFVKVMGMAVFAFVVGTGLWSQILIAQTPTLWIKHTPPVNWYECVKWLNSREYPLFIAPDPVIAAMMANNLKRDAKILFTLGFDYDVPQKTDGIFAFSWGGQRTRQVQELYPDKFWPGGKLPNPAQRVPVQKDPSKSIVSTGSSK